MHAELLLYCLGSPEFIALPIIIALYLWQTVKGREEQ